MSPNSTITAQVVPGEWLSDDLCDWHNSRATHVDVTAGVLALPLDRLLRLQELDGGDRLAWLLPDTTRATAPLFRVSVWDSVVAFLESHGLAVNDVDDEAWEEFRISHAPLCSNAQGAKHAPSEPNHTWSGDQQLMLYIPCASNGEPTSIPVAPAETSIPALCAKLREFGMIPEARTEPCTIRYQIISSTTVYATGRLFFSSTTP